MVKTSVKIGQQMPNILQKRGTVCLEQSVLS